jgi:hypothetical protein
VVRRREGEGGGVWDHAALGPSRRWLDLYGPAMTPARTPEWRGRSILNIAGNRPRWRAFLGCQRAQDGRTAMPITLIDEAFNARDLARRARRLASTLTSAEDEAALLRYADELEVQAVDLDRRAKEGG